MNITEGGVSEGFTNIYNSIVDKMSNMQEEISKVFSARKDNDLSNKLFSNADIQNTIDKNSEALTVFTS